MIKWSRSHDHHKCFLAGKMFFSIFSLSTCYIGIHRVCSVKKVFLIISQHLQENTYVGDSKARVFL